MFEFKDFEPEKYLMKKLFSNVSIVGNVFKMRR